MLLLLLMLCRTWGTVLLLAGLMFQTMLFAFTFLAQFGREYDVFPPTAPPGQRAAS